MMNRLIVLTLFVALTGFLGCSSAIVVGPYNLTIDLPGFNAINSVGPIGGSEGVDHVSYMVGIAEGNNTTASNNARRLTVDVTKFNMPIDINNKVMLSEAYDATIKSVYAGILWDTKDQVMIDRKLADHEKNLTECIDFICYFANPNLKVTLGLRNLTSEEFTRMLRTFHIQNV